MNAQKIALLLLIVALAAGGAALTGWKKAGELRGDNEVLREQLAALRSDLEQAKSTSGESESHAAIQSQRNEIMRLRNEITQLRTGPQSAANLQTELERLRAENRQLREAGTAMAAPPPLPAAPQQEVAEFPRESWAFAGYATPESALMSAIWAMREGQPEAYLDSLSPEEQERAAQIWQNQTVEQIAAKHQQDVASITGMRITDRQATAPGELTMTVVLDGANRTEQVQMRQVGNEWKFGGFIRNQ